MKISIIREFVHLCRTQNFTRTAEELYISQPVLSRHISSLEEELGVQLISRSRMSFELTPAGELARVSFEKILLEYQDLLSALSGLNESEQGELHLGVLYYDYTSYVEKIREVFRAQYPGITLHLHSYQPEQIETDLLNRKIDAAFLYSVDERKQDEIRSVPFLRIPISIMFESSHRLAEIPDIRFSDLSGEKILWPEAELTLSETKEIMQRIFAENHVTMSGQIPFSNFDDVPFLLKDTGAVYLSPMANQNAYHDSVKCRHIEPEKYYVTISTAWRSDNPNPAIRSLLNAVRITYP